MAGGVSSYRQLSGIRNALIHQDKKKYVEKKLTSRKMSHEKSVISHCKHTLDLSGDKPANICVVKSFSRVMLED